MQRPEAVLFDLWGTLISSEGFDPGLGNAAVLKSCDNPHGVTLEQVQGLGNRVMSALEGREDQSALEFTQAALLRIIADSFDLRFHNAMEEMEWQFWSAALEVRLIDGVKELLPHLQARGISMGVVSNSSFSGQTLERELDIHGIRGYFEFVISSADYGIRKPDPIIFEVALRRLSMDPGRVWFAGDNVGYDIVGARSADIFPVAFNPRAPIPESIGAHAVITQWSALVPLIEQAAADQ
jgi:putative hydrolase of the HAD superfamily